MIQIPQSLVDSLMELGLFESEAKMYAAIVLLRRAGVKDLRKSLGLSKPVIYAGMRSLEDRGMIMLLNRKPTTYQAMPPAVALDILMTTHQYHKEKALQLIRNLENEFYQGNPPDTLWYTLDKEQVESKIMDMLEAAKEKVMCGTSGKYLDLLQDYARHSLSFHFVIMSKDKAIQNRLELVFKGKANIQTVKKSQLLNFLAAAYSDVRDDKKQSLLDELNMLDVDSMFVLIIDDIEGLLVPMSMSSSPRKAMVIRNKALIQNIKLMFRMLIASEMVR